MSPLELTLLLTCLGLGVGLGLVVRQLRREPSPPVMAAAPENRINSLHDREADHLSQIADAAANAPLGIAVFDETGDQVFMNAVGADLTMATGDDAVLAVRLRDIVGESMGSAEPIEQTIELFSAAGRTVRLTAMPLAEGDSRVGTAAFIADQTSRSQVDSIRRDFIANASHELKTPLGALRLLAEALTATNDPVTRDNLSERVQSEAARMTRLVDDILDLALIEEEQPVTDRVDLCEVIAEGLEQTRLLADTLVVPVVSSCSTAIVAGDRRRLVSALANLIENAIAYTSAKGLDDNDPVEVRAYRRDGDALIEVEDRGIGIPERHIDRIFERFYRVDRGRSRASGGTGLGLAIVRHVVQNHDGRVEVESIPGKGSTFRIVLPTLDS